MKSHSPNRLRVATAALLTLTTTLLLPATEPAGPGIRLNTVGYLPEIEKTATVAGAKDTDHFFVVDAATGEVAWEGDLSEALPNAPQAKVQLADFSRLAQDGTYFLRVEGLPDSPRFTLSNQTLNHSLENIMLGFYGQRCGQAVRFEWQGKEYAYDACHLQDGWLDYLDPSRKGEQKDATGGWHDAGDYGKYSLNAAFSTAIMLLAWEHEADTLRNLELPFIPEHGGPLPDYLAELKYNLDWLLKMQTESGDVAHKLTTLNFGPMKLPNEISAKRYFTETSKVATLSFAAVGCIAARVYRSYDTSYAQLWDEVARRAWEASRSMPDERPDTSAFSTGNYFGSIEGHYKWALIEARLAFGEKNLNESERAQFEELVSSNGRLFDLAWDWGNGYNLGLYSWLFSEEAKTHPSSLGHLQNDLILAADTLVAQSKSHPHGRGVESYKWGGNGVVARITMTLNSAYRISGDKRYLDAAFNQIAYLYGRNPFARSFVTGEGFEPPLRPHHRPSVGDEVEKPWPGHLIGGANPGELDWFDETASYRTNETAINWDASLAYALSIFYRP